MAPQLTCPPWPSCPICLSPPPPVESPKTRLGHQQQNWDRAGLGTLDPTNWERKFPSGIEIANSDELPPRIAETIASRISWSGYGFKGLTTGRRADAQIAHCAHS